MGVVSKQASITSLFSYIGVVIGFVNFTLLMANWFTPEQVGLREALLSIAVFGSQISHFGAYRSVVKFYPFFKSDTKYDNGLLRLGIIVPFFGFLVMSGLIILFKEPIISFYADNSPLLVEYFWFSFPLFFFLMYNNVFENYLLARSKTIYSVFLKSILTRLMTTILLCLYCWDLIDFYWFIVYFNLSYLVTIVLFILHLNRRGEFSLKLNLNFFTKRIRRVYFNYSIFSILSSTSSILVTKIDTIMISGLIGLSSTSVYANAIYFSVLIGIPGDAISRISMPIISNSWKRKKIDEIEVLYKKTSSSQFLLGGIVLVLIWASIDNFYQLQRIEYAAGKYTFLILGISKLIHMLFGINGQIISITKFYRFDTTTALLLGIITVVTNYTFIPKWGIEGAALATALSLIGFNVIRYIFIYVKMKIQPFSKSTIIIGLIVIGGFGINEILPNANNNIYLDTIIRSVLIGAFMISTAYFTKVSPDINQFIKNSIKRIVVN